MDLAAVRRVWPDVLERISGIRRVTWTFLSQHAQVVDYDGSKLVLGIATRGLTNTFRQGNHAEVVRQALIEAVALDVRVEGISLGSAPTAPTAAAGEPPDAGGARADDETLDERIEAGQSVIERLLGARVLDESPE